MSTSGPSGSSVANSTDQAKPPKYRRIDAMFIVVLVIAAAIVALGYFAGRFSTGLCVAGLWLVYVLIYWAILKYRRWAAKKSLSDEAIATAAEKKQQKLKKIQDSPHPRWVKEALHPDRQLGWRRFVWLLYAKTSAYSYRWIPVPRAFGNLRKEIELNSKFVHAAWKSLGKLILATLNIKGGAAKTTVATWVAAFLMRISLVPAVIIDLDTGGGKVTRRFGIMPDKTLSTNDAIARVMPNGDDQTEPDWTPSHEDMIEEIERDPITGVHLLHMKPVENLSRSVTVQAIRTLKKPYGIAVLDTGPGLGREVTDAAVEVANIHLLTADYQRAEDLNDIKTTLDHGVYGLRDGTASSNVVVLSNVPNREYNIRTQYEWAEAYGLKPKQVVLIPRSLHMAKSKLSDDARKPTDVTTGRVDHTALDLQAEHAFSVLSRLIAEIATRLSSPAQSDSVVSEEVADHSEKQLPEDLPGSDITIVDHPAGNTVVPSNQPATAGMS